MKDIVKYAEQDRSNHIGMSGEPLKFHADEKSECTISQRKEYFQGIMTIFPMMLMGNYYTWLTDTTPDEYMKTFVPMQQSRVADGIEKLLDMILNNFGESSIWKTAISAYLSLYPAEMLKALVRWGFPEVPVERMESFLKSEREIELPKILQEIAKCENAEQRDEFAYWMGTKYPFDLLVRFHLAVIDENK